MDVGTIVASGWTSGLSLYVTAFLLGVAGRLGWTDVPGALTEPVTLSVLAVLSVVEFVADKVPWLDSAWDSVHLVVRPVGGALLSGMLAEHSGSPELLLGLTGGGLALSSHSAKSATRALINTSPEPVSNVVVSFAEDGIVMGMVAFAVAFPVVAGVLAVIFAVCCVVATWILLKLVKRARAALRARKAARVGRAASP